MAKLPYLNRLGVISLLFVTNLLFLALRNSSALAQDDSIFEPNLFVREVRISNLRIKSSFKKGLDTATTAHAALMFAQLEESALSSKEDASPEEMPSDISEEDKSGPNIQTGTETADSVLLSDGDSTPVSQDVSAPKKKEVGEDQTNNSTDKPPSKRPSRQLPLPEPVLTTDETVEFLSEDELMESYFSDKQQIRGDPAALAFIIAGTTAVVSVVLLLHGLANSQTEYSTELLIGSAVTGAVSAAALGTGLFLSLSDTANESDQTTHARRSRSSRERIDNEIGLLF
jgi:hypothetical protein